MKPRNWLLAASIGSWCLAGMAWAVPGTDIIAEPAAERHGLTRAWFTQMQIDPARGRVKELVLEQGTLYVLSDQSVLSAMDASTGQPRWTVEVGSREHPTLTPAANGKFVAVINGSYLYVLNRFNGKLLLKTQLEAAPAAGPALSQQRVYVPLLDGRLVAYRLKIVRDPLEADLAAKRPLSPEEQAAREIARRESLQLEQRIPPPLFASAPGRPMVQPLVVREDEGEENVVWATDQGFLCVGRVNRNDERALELRYRLQTERPIVAPPAYLPPDANVLPDTGLIIVGSEDGYVHAIRERTGDHYWRFSTGEPIIERPMAFGRYVFVTNQLGGMYCLDAKDEGKQLWWAPEVTRFLAASKERIYTTDKVGLLHVLSAQSGAHLDSVAVELLPLKLTNMETDRLYLASKTGLVQCLHEPSAVQPLVRRVPPKELDLDKPRVAKKAAEEKPTEEVASADRKGTTKSSGAPRLSSSKTGSTKKSAGRTGGTGAAAKPRRAAQPGMQPGMGAPGMVPPGMAPPGMMPPGAGGKVAPGRKQPAK